MKRITKIERIIITTMFMLTLNIQSVHGDNTTIFEYIDKTIEHYWNYSDAIERRVIKTKEELYKVTYCYYMESLKLDCSLELQKQNAEHVEKIFEDVPLPMDKLSDKSMRIINVEELLKNQPLVISVDVGIATVKVNHLIAKNRKSNRASNIFRAEDDKETDSYLLSKLLQGKVVKRLIIDIGDVTASDLSVVMDIIAQLVSEKPKQDSVLVKYNGVEIFGNRKVVVYDIEPIEKSGALTIKAMEKNNNKTTGGEREHWRNQELKLDASLRTFTETPVEIRVNENTRGYAELIPIILSKLNKDVTVIGETSGSLTAESRMGEDAIGIKGKEFIFSGGELFVTDGSKLVPYRFKGFVQDKE